MPDKFDPERTPSLGPTDPNEAAIGEYREARAKGRGQNPNPDEEPKPGFIERREAEEVAHEEMIARLREMPPVSVDEREQVVSESGVGKPWGEVRALSGNIAPTPPPPRYTIPHPPSHGEPAGPIGG